MEPSFRDAIIANLGQQKGDRLLQAFAPMKVLSFQKLNAIAACDDVSIFKRNLNALIARAVLVTRLPSPLEEIINSAIKMWVMFRKSGGETPRGSAPKRARALTLREHAIADAFTREKPLFVKTVLGQPPSTLHKESSPPGSTPLLLSQGSAGSSNAGSQLSLGTSTGRRNYVPRKIFFANLSHSTPRDYPPTPPSTVPSFLDIFTSDFKNDPSLWEVSLLFREGSSVFRSLDRTMCPPDVIRDIVATAFSKRSSAPQSVRNIARFAGAFAQFAYVRGLPTTGEDSLAAIVQWLKPLHTRGFTVPRNGLYALRVIDEALGLQLPIRSPAVLAAARTTRSKIRKQAPLMPYTFVIKIIQTAEDSSISPGLRAFASGIVLMIMATFRWADVQWINEINQNETVVFGVCQKTKSNSEPFYWAAPLEGLNNSTGWLAPVIEARARFVEVTGNKYPRHIFFHTDAQWNIQTSKPMKYATAFACLQRLAKYCGFADVKYTLHSPRAVMPTWANQLGWSKEDRTALGRWAPNSEMPNWYDRAVCNTELRLRYTIIQNCRSGWTPLQAFALPKPKITDNKNDSSSADSTSVLDSSEQEVDIADLDDTGGKLSGYASFV